MDLLDLLNEKQSIDAAINTLDAKLHKQTTTHAAPTPTAAPTTGKPLGPATALAYCDAFRLAIVARDDSKIDVVDVDRGRVVATAEVDGAGGRCVVGAAAAGPDVLVVAAFRDKVCQRWLFEKRAGNAWTRMTTKATASRPLGDAAARAVAVGSKRVAIVLPKQTYVLDLASLEATATLDAPGGGAFRGACWTKDGALAVVGSFGAATWRPNAPLVAVPGVAGAARAVAATPSGGFVVALEAAVAYREDRSGELREVAKAAPPLFVARDDAVPLIVRPAAAPGVVGEVSFSGFGGGNVPAGFLLARDDAPPPAPAPPRASTPRLARVEEARGAFAVAASAAVAALPRGAALVDHVACHGDEVSAASGFDAHCTVARFALDGLAPRPSVALAPPAAKSRVRGLAARGNGDLVALVQLDAKAAPLCGIGAAAAPAEARVVDVARSPAPVAAAAPKAPKPKAAAAPPPPAPRSGGLAAELADLRRHVDARFDALESKLDAVLARL